MGINELAVGGLTSPWPSREPTPNAAGGLNRTCAQHPGGRCQKPSRDTQLPNCSPL